MRKLGMIGLLAAFVFADQERRRIGDLSLECGPDYRRHLRKLLVATGAALIRIVKRSRLTLTNASGFLLID